MLSKLKRLEQEAKLLEPNRKTRVSLAQEIEQFIQDFFDEVSNSPAYQADHYRQSFLSILETPSLRSDWLNQLKQYVINPGVNVTSPGFLGYIPSGGLYISALADYIAAATNCFAGAYFISPGAARLENTVVAWLCQLIGYESTAGGTLTSGGSMANFIALVAAREEKDLPACNFSRCVIYVTSQTHHSNIKGLRIAGLKEAILRYVPVDNHFKMKTHLLEQMIKKDRRNHLIPWLIIATLGTTNTGSVDPIKKISDIALRYQLWLHVDAAYGGFFILCPTVRKIIQPMSLADSITVDPHKGLFLPYGTGAVLTKKVASLLTAFYYNEFDYLPNKNDLLQISSTSVSPELSRPFRGLRLWLPLKWYGLGPFTAALNEKLLLTQFLYHQLRKDSRIEFACKPQLSVLTFRYHPKKGDANKFNEQIFEKIKADGQVFFSKTQLDHKTFLRIATLSFRTHLDTILLAIDKLYWAIEQINKT